MQQAYKLIVMLTVLLFGGTVLLFANGEAVYNVANIKPQLLENAEAVVRADAMEAEIVPPSKLTINYKYAVTILKESALSMSRYSIPYDKHSKVGAISVTVYNKDGVKVKKLKTDDIFDVSDIDDGTIYSDSRRKAIDPRYQVYPFTVEYEYSVVHESTMGLPDFTVFSGYNVSVENSSLAITCPNTYQLRYKELNGIMPVKENTVGSKTTYTWAETDFAARNPEPQSPSPYETYPYVIVGPSVFEFDGYKGDFSTWQTFGQFVQQLTNGRDKLPEKTIAQIKELVKDCPNDFEKIKKIYEYAQQKNRYISIQIGIGGLQPFDAETVDRLSYGDCKALSNYVKALLNVAGIKAFYTVIELDEVPSKVYPEFPSNVFNHVVVCVPLPNDTVWLECTNPYIACGHFGKNTHNRLALLVDGDNSHLVKTPKLGADENVVSTNATATIFAEGHAKVEMQQHFSGIHYGKYLGLKLMDETDRRKTLIKLVDFPNFQLTDYKITDDKSRHPFVDMQLKLDVYNMASAMGPRLVLKLNQHNQQNYIPPYARKREAELMLVNDHVELDTITYVLPQGYKAEGLPDPVTLETPYGRFSAKSETVDNKIVYTRKFEIISGRHKPEEFNLFRDFLEKVAAADNAKCFLVKK